MKTTPFITVDVFTDQAFGGNPLAIFPDAREISADEMQKLAREFNLSETCFVLPPADPANSARIRIFDTTAEMPFAGHPLVGTGFVLAGLRGLGETELRFEVPAGLVILRIDRDDLGKIVHAEITAPRPLQVGEALEPGIIAACAGLPEAAIIVTNHPPVTASVGNPFIIAEVSLENLQRAVPNIAAFQAAAARFPAVATRFSLHLYARHLGRLHARMFGPLTGTLEDPATGSANAPLAGLLLSLTNQSAARFEEVQGVEMGRPSRLLARAWREGSQILTAVGGGCVPMFEGSYPLRHQGIATP
jgi:trans-2,3-dihydro-3-hydroxyanthranilate isomerase